MLIEKRGEDEQIFCSIAHDQKRNGKNSSEKSEGSLLKSETFAVEVHVDSESVTSVSTSVAGND